MAAIKDSRNAHPAGQCCLTYTSDGKILTCGAEEKIRIFNGPNEDAATHVIDGNEVYAVACSTSRIYVAVDGTNAVHSYVLSNGKSESKNLLRFTDDVTTLDLSNDEKYLIAGSGDMTIKVLNLETFKEVLLEGHQAPILSVSFDKTNDQFALSTSCDGSLKLWNREDGICMETIENVFPASNDASISKTRGIASWSSKDSTFSFPLKSSVKIFSRQLWEEVANLKTPTDLETDELLSVTAWSPCGRFIVSGSSQGNLFVWNIEAKSLLASLKVSSGFCSVQWKKNDEIAFITNKGVWGIIMVEVDKLHALSSKIEEEKEENKHLVDFLFGDDDDDDDDSFSIRKIKKDTGFLSDDDESNLSKPASIAESEDITLQMQNKPVVSEVIAAPPIQFQPDLQEPFQPGSTPDNLSVRFMVWNSVGIVRAVNSEEENTIGVEFHDTTAHHPIHLSNSHHYTMADLSNNCLVLASEAEPEGMETSRIFCYHFASSDNSKEWSFVMPEREDIMAIGCGRDWIAVATDMRRLRIFTLTGIQLDILSLPGPVVALTGWNSKLLVILHSGMPLQDNQNMIYACLNIGEVKHPSALYQPLPLTPNSYLSWIGFTDEGTPCLQDSAGMVKLVNKDYQSWIEVSNMKKHTKGVSDHYFVVGVNEQEGNIRCILCKGSRYPPAVPKPTIVLVNLSFPLCDAFSEKGTLEEKILKNRIHQRAISVDEPEFPIFETKEDLVVAQNETLVKLFALSCKADQESRAFDVCKLMNTNTIQIAIKFATKTRRMQLANRLNDLACNIQEEEEAQAASEKVGLDVDESTQGSIDMFATQAEEEDEAINPLLVAKKRRNNEYQTKSNLNASQNTRNPFKKKTVDRQSSVSNSEGIVFDGMKAKTPSSKLTASQFGSNLVTKLGTVKKKNSGKENSSINKGEEAKPLKGFQLWLAENLEDLEKNYSALDDSDRMHKSLEIWRSLNPKEKEDFQTPRIPRSSKRKREEAEIEVESPMSKSVKFS